MSSSSAESPPGNAPAQIPEQAPEQASKASWRALGWLGVGVVTGLLAAVLALPVEDHDHGDSGDETHGAASPDGGASDGGAMQDDHAGHDHFDDAMLAAMGVKVDRVRLRDFTAWREIQAVVEHRPMGVQPVVAPLGGTVASLHVVPGDGMAAGDPVATLLRAPLPAPQLQVTGELFAPLQESVHTAAGQLRTARRMVEFARVELARYRELGPGSVGRDVLARWEEAAARAEQEVANAHAELHFHGFSEDQIVYMAAGGHPGFGTAPRIRVLDHHGLWQPPIVQLAGLVSGKDRTPETLDPWTIALIGELSSRGMVGDAFLLALQEVPGMQRAFPEVATLLLNGRGLQEVRSLAETGQLDGAPVLRAPEPVADGGSRWRVRDVLVRAGEVLATGQRVVLLEDLGAMQLRLRPVGSREWQAVQRAWQAGTSLTARSLLAEEGPDLDGLTLQRLEDDTGIIWCRGGEAIGDPGQSTPRQPSPLLRAGVSYGVRVPAATFEDVLVVPVDAIAEQGPVQVVFTRAGEHLDPVPVEVLHSDHEYAVIKPSDALQDGFAVAMSGAVTISLALSLQGGGDPHAGHSH